MIMQNGNWHWGLELSPWHWNLFNWIIRLFLRHHSVHANHYAPINFQTRPLNPKPNAAARLHTRTLKQNVNKHTNCIDASATTLKTTHCFQQIDTHFYIHICSDLSPDTKFQCSGASFKCMISQRVRMNTFPRRCGHWVVEKKDTVCLCVYLPARERAETSEKFIIRTAAVFPCTYYASAHIYSLAITQTHNISGQSESEIYISLYAI